MATFLLTYNPKSKRWKPKELAEFAARCERGELGAYGWTCGALKSIAPGDRVFLLRQGRDQPGIHGAGWATTESYEDMDSDGTMTQWVDFKWDALKSFGLGLSRDVLLDGILTPSQVNSQSGGVTLHTETAAKLEKKWARHLHQPIASASALRAPVKEGDPIEYTGYRRKRDRQLRNEAFSASRGICQCCRRNFKKVLGDDYIHVLQVHHTKQLGYRQKPRLTRFSDLAVVCANCHCLIHMDPKEALTVEKLRNRLKRK